jgi:radical SAM protein with 4Fe4S-binding SPASM domain
MLKLLEKLGYAPRVVVWELTLRCNLRCRHCGSRAGEARDDELGTDEALAVCRELAAMKCKHVTLSGGEPTLRPDWPLLARTLADLGVTVGMISNGVGWTDELARTAKAAGLESVAFSVDGLEATHDHVRHAKGHFRRALGAIACVRRAGLPVSAVTTISKPVIAELAALRGVLAEHGVRRWQVQLATPTGNLVEHPELVLDPEDVLVVVPLVVSMCRDGQLPKLYPGHDIGYYGEPEERLRDPNHPIPYWMGCTAGLSVLGLESNGNVKGCLSLPSAMNGVDRFVEGNVRDGGLRAIWERDGAFAYNRRFTVEDLGGACRACEYAEICRGGCTWMTFASAGVRDNAYCYLRQLRARDAGGAAHVRLPVVS